MLLAGLLQIGVCIAMSKNACAHEPTKEFAES